MDRVKDHNQTAPASSCKVYADSASILAYGGGNISRPRYNNNYIIYGFTDSLWLTILT